MQLRFAVVILGFCACSFVLAGLRLLSVAISLTEVYFFTLISCRGQFARWRSTLAD